MGLCPTMEPSTPFVQRPSFACRINQLPARKNWPWPFLSIVSQVRCRLLIGPAADGVLDALDARFVDQGANLAIIEVKSPGELLFRELVNGTWLASPIQVYLDLMRGEGRAREMAKHLRHERIGF